MASKKLVISSSVLVLIVILAFGFYQSKLPQRNGTLNLQGLQQIVTVHFDEWGIPHIIATHDQDAQIALGYLHAQERFFQMDLLRRVGAGRMSEIFGEDALQADIFFRTIGIERFAEWFVANQLDQHPELKAEIDRYLAGINQYLEHNSAPIEYSLLRVDPQPFVYKDVFVISGYMAYTFAQAYKTDPMLTYIQQTLGDKYFKSFNTHWPDYAPVVETSPSDTDNQNQKLSTQTESNKLPPQDFGFLLDLALEVNKISHEQLPVGLFQGSNSWVVSGQRTATGKPLFANDPHIAFAAPSTWFEAHINTPTYEIYGHYLAGIPFPILGHNKKFAYGMTMWENDDVDFYFEEINEDKSQVKHKGQWVALTQHHETINIKGAGQHQFIVYETPHGPLINGLIGKTSKDKPVSLFWTFLDKQNNPLNGIALFSKTKNIEEFEQAVSQHWSPGLNINYADTDGNIAMWAAGRLPNRPATMNSYLINDGANGQFDIDSYLDFSHNPRIINPSSGIIYSANHPYDTKHVAEVAGYYVPEGRAITLKEKLFTHQGPFTTESFKNLQNNHYKYRAKIVVDQLLQVVDQKSLWLEHLSNWNHEYPVDAIAPGIFERFYFHLNKLTFADEMGERGFLAFRNTHMLTLNFLHFFADNHHFWWDNINTKDTVESRDDIIQLAWNTTLEQLTAATEEELTWGQLHTVEHEHPLGKVDSIRSLFNVGPAPSPGSRETINNMYHPLYSNRFPIKAGPSTRRIIDLNDPETSWGINPTGNSGVPLDQHYDDQFDLHIQGIYRQQFMNMESILKNKVSTLTIMPG